MHNKNQTRDTEPIEKFRSYQEGKQIMSMTVEIRNNKLCIEIDLEKPTPSSSGKTLVVASTRGNVVTQVEVDGKPVTIGLNAYIKP
jgi:hypothetical protein